MKNSRRGAPARQPRLAGLKESFIDDEVLYATHAKVAGMLKKYFA